MSTFRGVKIVYIGNALSRRGVAPTSADILPTFFRAEDIDVIVASGYRNILLRMVHMLLTILRRASSVDFVLIDVYSTKNFWYAFFCAQLCRLLRLRYIPILHGGDFPRRMARSPSAVSMVLSHAHRVVVPSGYLFDALAKRGYASRLLPNAIPVASYGYATRATVQPRLFYVRAFSRIYCPQMALKVLHLLREDYPEASLCMVGPDKDGTLQECRLLAKALGLQHAVTFTGMLDKASWHELSTGYDIFINTSTKDNMPVSVIEAMALGLPVVSTNPGGIPYLIEDGHDGLLVGVGETEEMVRAIKRLVETPKLALAISANARKKAESFDWSFIKHQWLDVLNTREGVEV